MLNALVVAAIVILFGYLAVAFLFHVGFAICVACSRFGRLIDRTSQSILILGCFCVAMLLMFGPPYLIYLSNH